MEYILSERRNGCVFCDELDHPDGVDNLIVFRGEYSFIILNRYPYTSGHLMVVPYLHKASLEELNPAIRGEMMELVSKAIRVLRIAYQPHGFNIGANLGEVAGAGILDHIHLHLVPRWGGDTNFMSALAETRVLPELLADTYLRVVDAWHSLTT
jgi:ATP adenylyltransferase